MSAQDLAEKWNAAQAEFEEGRFAECAAILLEHQELCRQLEDHEPGAFAQHGRAVRWRASWRRTRTTGSASSSTRCA